MTETTATLEPVEAFKVEEPGVYNDIPELDYHADCVPEGSLSVSGAKKLLPPSAPALFKWERDNVRPPKREFDFGHAAHALVLGAGAEIVVVDSETWNTNAVKAEVAAIRAAGKTPLKPSAMAVVEAMAAELRSHPLAGPLLTQGTGTPEASLFWRDPETGVMRRGRIDWLPNARDGRMILVDYKSAVSAEPQRFGRSSAADYGYYMQAPWYVDGVLELGLADDAAFVFVVQEKTPPYLVSVIELDALAMRIGRHDNRKALRLFVECMTTDTWPGYSDDVSLVSLPGWLQHRYAEESA